MDDVITEFQKKGPALAGSDIYLSLVEKHPHLCGSIDIEGEGFELD
jgi:hypothetical protein